MKLKGNITQRLVRAVIRRPLAVVAAVIVISIISLIGAFNLRFEFSIYDLDTSEFASVSALQQMDSDFKDGRSVIVITRPADHLSKMTVGDLCSLKVWLGNELLENEFISQIKTSFDIRKPQQKTDRLWYPKVLSDPCGLPANNLAESYLDPLKESGVSELFLSKNRTTEDFIFEVSFKDMGGSTHFNPKEVGAFLNRLKNHVAKDNLNLEVLLAGRRSFQWYFKEALAKDSLINGAFLLLCLLFIRIVFGSWRMGALLAGTIALTGLWMYGFFGIFGIPIDILSSNLFLIVGLANIEDFIFIVSRTKFTKETYLEAAAQISLPGFLTTFTTMIGFLSLVVTEFPTLKRFGFGAAFGTLIEWVLVFMLLPALATLYPKLIKTSDTRVDPWLEKVTSLNFIRAPKSLVILLVAVPLSAPYFLNLLKIEDSPIKSFPESHDQIKAYRHLVDTRGWQSLLFVVKDETASTPNLAEWRELKKEILGLPNVEAFESAPDWLDGLSGGLSEPSKAVVESDVFYSGAKNFFFSDTGLASRAVVYLKSINLSDVSATLQGIQAVCAQKTFSCAAVGEQVVFNEYSHKILKNMLDSLSVGLGLVILSLGIMSRGFPFWTRFSLIVSAAWGPLALLILIAVAQIPINLITSVVFGVLVGLCGDNAIQLFYRAKMDGTFEVRNSQIDVAALAIIICLVILSALLWAMTLTPINTLGTLLIMGFLLNYTGDFWVLNNVLGLKRK